MVMVSQATTNALFSGAIYVDHINEATAAHGVVIDGVTLKDGGGTFTGALTATTGTFSGAVSITNTTSPLLTLAYDGSNYATFSVANDGLLTIDSVGTDAGIRLNDNTAVGFDPIYSRKFYSRFYVPLDVGYAVTAIGAALDCSLMGDPGDTDRRTVYNAALTSSPDVATTQSGHLHLYRGTLSLGSLGTNSAAYGYYVETAIGAASLVTDLYNFYSRGATNHGTLTNGYGYYYESISDYETVVNEYGVYLEDVVAGTTLNYAIYTNAGLVRFGGNTSVTGVTSLGDGGTTNYTEIKADGEINLHGTARVKRDVWIPASGVRAPGASPATWVDHGISGVWQFSDTGSAEDKIVFNLKLPNDMDRSVAPTINVGWSCTNTGNVVWQLEYLYTALNEDTSAAAEETLTETDAASATAEGLVVTAFDGVNVPGSTDVCVHCRLSRMDSSGNDTVGADVELHGVCLEYTANKLGTAT